MNKPPFYLVLLALVLLAETAIAASPTPTPTSTGPVASPGTPSAGTATPTPTPAAEEKIADLPAPKTTSVEPPKEVSRADPPSTGALKPPAVDVAPLKINLTPGQTGVRDIYDELTVFVELANTGKEVITLNYVYLQVGDDVKRTRDLSDHRTPTPTHTPTSATSSTVSGERARGALNQPEDGIWEGREQHTPIKLNPNGSRTERLVIPRAEPTGYISGLLRNQYLLTFSPREHDIHVMVEYAVGSQDDLSLRSTLKVSFTSTWGAIMLGGCVGVAMLCVLRIILASEKEFRALYNDPAVDAAAVSWASIGRRARHRAARELIASIVWFPSVMIISFLLWRMGPSSFPITFQVNDFAGGVLLGLFTRALVEPLIRKLFPDSDNPPPVPVEAGSATVTKAV